jgi:hypothetical protein
LLLKLFIFARWLLLKLFIFASRLFSFTTNPLSYQPNAREIYILQLLTGDHTKVIEKTHLYMRL